MPEGIRGERGGGEGGKGMDCWVFGDYKNPSGTEEKGERGRQGGRVGKRDGGGWVGGWGGGGWREKVDGPGSVCVCVCACARAHQQRCGRLREHILDLCRRPTGTWVYIPLKPTVYSLRPTLPDVPQGLGFIYP